MMQGLGKAVGPPGGGGVAMLRTRTMQAAILGDLEVTWCFRERTSACQFSAMFFLAADGPRDTSGFKLVAGC